MISAFDELMINVKKYITKKEDLDLIAQAYLIANKLHGEAGQCRLSGEPYIVHPLSVANILANWNQEPETIAAGLLHDTVEDVKGITITTIEEQFKSPIASLVDGVTKIRNLNSTKEKENAFNQRKILDALQKDIRIVIIKLADRLHNVRTIEYHSPSKQQEIAKETLRLYVPLAYRLGMYTVKKELEDLCLQVLQPLTYQKLKEEYDNYNYEVKDIISDMMSVLSDEVKHEGIEHRILRRDKNIFGIYRNYIAGKTLAEMHDLLGIKIILANNDNIGDCYRALGIVHDIYRYLQEIKVYLRSGKKMNLYESLHTTVITPNNRLAQVRIRTEAMEKIADLGMISPYQLPNGHEIAQKMVLENFPSLKAIVELNKMTKDDIEFIKAVECELSFDSIYVRDKNGQYVFLPASSTVVDFAFRNDPELAEKISSAIVNGRFVELDYVLRNDDLVQIITKEGYLQPETLIKSSKTPYTIKKINGGNH